MMKYIQVKVGDVVISNNSDIVIQSMCNTNTLDIELSVAQCKALFDKGAKIVRLTTQGLKEVEALKEIKNRLSSDGYGFPLVADVHFSYNVAIEAAKVADKVRINPGNFAKEHNIAKEQFAKLIQVCKEYGTALRIGINHGSLGERIIEKYGNGPQGMKEAAMEWICMAKENDFDQIIISLKASNTYVMAQANIMLYEAMKNDGIIFPLHLGITEAGNGIEARIKSAVGLSTILSKGIGETIRVSLTENPIYEIDVAKKIIDFCLLHKDSYSINYNKINHHFIVDASSFEDLAIKSAVIIGPPLLERFIDDFTLDATIDGVEISCEEVVELKNNIMQAARRKFTKPEYIACPGCGRTLFNLESVFNEVKRRTSHLVGYNIAVMGCIVNGPGEMADADYGYIGEGKNRVSIYRGTEPVYRSVPEDKAIDMLLELIQSDERNKDDHPQS